MDVKNVENTHFNKRYSTWSELNQQVLEKAGKLDGKTRLLGISLKVEIVLVQR